MTAGKPVKDTTATFVLYHSLRSTCSQKVRLCLVEKELPYEDRVLDLTRFEHHSPEYLELNPNGYVPTLVHDNVPLIESSLINEYLDDIFRNPPLSPETSEGRYRMRIWGKLVDDLFAPAVVIPTWSKTIAPWVKALSRREQDEAFSRIPLRVRRTRWERIAGEGFSNEEFREAMETVELCLNRMEQALSCGSDWLLGERLTLADINILPYVIRAGEIDTATISKGTRPAIHGWLQRFSNRRSYKAVYAGPGYSAPAT